MTEHWVRSLQRRARRAEFLRAAVCEIRGHYPEDIFPDDGQTVDSRSGRFARSLCDQIIALAEEMEMRHNDGPDVAE